MNVLTQTSIATAAMGLLLLTGCARPPADEAGQAAAPAKPVKLKLVSSYPLDLPILGTTIVRMADRCSAATEGRLTIKAYEPGALVHAKEILDAVSTGKVDAGYGSAGFWQGQLPAGPLFSSVPFGPETGEYLGWMLHGNGMKLYQEMYDRAGLNIKVLIVTVLPPETSGWFARPIETVDDLKGLRIRFFGLGGNVMSRLGAGVEQLSAADIFPALEKGRLDATEFSMPIIDQRMGFHKIVKFNYYPGWHQQATLLELIINKETWNSLGTAHQTIIELACRDAMIQSLADGEGSQFEAMREQTDEQGVQRRKWPPEMLAAFEAAWQEVAAEESAKDEFFKRVWEDLQAFRKGYDLWESNAFLPRAESVAD